jgi:DNA-binding cell septation regulator SpoVG
MVFVVNFFTGGYFIFNEMPAKRKPQIEYEPVPKRINQTVRNNAFCFVRVKGKQRIAVKQNYETQPNVLNVSVSTT